MPMINCLLENGANVHVCAADGEPLLLTLLLSGWQDDVLQIAEALVSHGCDPLEANPSGKTLLRIAVERCLVSIVQYFFSLGISSSPDLLHIPLRFIDRWSKTQMVFCLLEHTTDVRIRAANGEPLLHTLLSSTQDGEYAAQTVEALVSRGCDPWEADPSGKTPLRIAVEQCLVPVVQYFLSLGISPSPDLLHTALRWKNGQIKVQMVFCLLEHTTNVHTCAVNGEPLLHTLLSSTWTWDDEYAVWITKAFVSHGCDPLEANPSGRTPLRIAVEQCLVHVARYFLSLGIPPSPDLLHTVLRSENGQIKTQMVSYLLEHTTDVCTCAANGEPLLHTLLLSTRDREYAVQTAEALVSHGCDPLEANPSGKTLLYIAVERYLVPVARYFLSLGISPSPDLLHTALQWMDGQVKTQMAFACWNVPLMSALVPQMENLCSTRCCC